MIGVAVIKATTAIFDIIYVLIIIRVFSSWLPFLYNNNFTSKLLYMVESLTEPIMNPVRKLMQKTPMGNMPVDFSPIIVLLLLQVVQTILVVILQSVLL